MNKTLVPFHDIEGYMPVDECFVKDLDKDKLFMVVADNDNATFGIKRGAYILCAIRDAENDELVVDRENLSLEQGSYKVMKMVKKEEFTYLENSRGRKIAGPDYKNFGVVLKIFNVDQAPPSKERKEV